METLKLVLQIIFSAIYWYAIVACIVVILLENNNPVRSISWVVILLFLPYIGLLFYIVFGRSYHRQQRLSRKLKSKISNCAVPAQQRIYEHPKSSLLEKYSGLISLLENTGDAQLYGNNDVTIYTDGKKLFQQMVQDIEKATNHIHAEYYIIESDKTGEAFKNLLIKKAKEGVEVRLIYDDVGSWHLKHSTRVEMREAGIKLQSFFRVRFPYFTSKLNYRNHRKIIVVDGKVGYLGGFNIADRYTKGLDWGIWRDTHMRFEGDGVAGLQTLYLWDWLYVTKKLHQTPRFFPRSEIQSKTALQVVGSGPDHDWQCIMQGFCYAISHAKKYIYIQTPYFIPNEAITNALEMAALSGIDVRLIIPEHSDSKISLQASLSYLKPILMSGIKVLRYQKGFMHAKTMVIDDELSIIGSANLDFRSFEQNFEVSSFIYDTDKAIEMKNIFLQDAKNSRKLSFYAWKNRPVRLKIIQGLARLFSPVL